MTMNIYFNNKFETQMNNRGDMGKKSDILGGRRCRYLWSKKNYFELMNKNRNFFPDLSRCVKFELGRNYRRQNIEKLTDSQTIAKSIYVNS